jgi:hypothetical protein
MSAARNTIVLQDVHLHADQSSRECRNSCMCGTDCFCKNVLTFVSNGFLFKVKDVEFDATDVLCFFV